MSAPDWESEVEALVAASRSAGPDEKVRLLEAAVRLADHHGDLDRGFQLRSRLISAATFSAHQDKALVAFAWCRARAQEDPRWQSHDLVWKHKWVIDSLVDHPSVTREQITAAHDDYAAAVEQRGGSPRAPLKTRLRAALEMGDLDDAQRWYAGWRDASRDGNSDCVACDVHFEVWALVRWSRWEEALERAAPIRAGKLRCAEVPHETYPLMNRASFVLGRLEEARDALSRGYPLVRGNRKYISTIGDYLAFLALTDNDGPALTLFERHLEAVLESRSPLQAVPFHRAARFLFERLSSGPAAETELALRLPRVFPLHREEGLYGAATLRDWFDARSADLAARFDARNGNAFYTRELEASRGWAGEVKPFPVRSGFG